MRSDVRKAMHWVGSALAITGVGFVLWRLHTYGSEIEFDRLNGVAWLVVAVFAFINGSANLMLALAWWNLLGRFGACTTRLWAVRTYGMTQLAKYVPGNIFHLAGRQAIGMAAGLPGWPLAQSSAWELGLISAAGGVFALLALPLLVPGLSAAVSVGVFAAVTGITTSLLWRLIGSPVARAFGWHMGFFTVSGILFVGLIELIIESPGGGSLHWLPLVGACVLAWLIGLVTPGAPAGVGVREMVLLFMLKGVIGEEDLLLTVVLGRMVTIGGDLLTYFASFCLKKEQGTILHDCK